MSAVPMETRGVAIPRGAAGTRTMPNEHHGLDKTAESGAMRENEELKMVANTVNASLARGGLVMVRESMSENLAAPAVSHPA